MKRALVWIAWTAFVLAWFLPVVHNGVSLPEGVPGWEAFMVAASVLVPSNDAGPWWSRVLPTLSAGTNLLAIVAPWLSSQPGERTRRILVPAFAAAFVVNSYWWFIGADELSVGYYVWWLSFAGLTLAIWLSARRAPAR
jgi:hypothetical protein